MGHLRSISIWLCCPPISEPRSMCCLILVLFLHNNPFPGLLRSTTPGYFLIPIQCLFFNEFIPFPRGMTEQSQFPLSNSYYYRLLFGTSHSSVLLFILGHLMPIILRKHRFTNICNLSAICIINFHVLHPYKKCRVNTNIKYTDLSLHQCIFILAQCVQFHEDPICPSDPCFNVLQCSSVCHTALPTHVNCSTHSITTLFILPFVVTFEFILSSFVLLDCSRKVKPKFQLHMDFSTGVLIRP